MNNKRTLTVLALVVSLSGLGSLFLVTGSEPQPVPAQAAVQNYLIDNNQQIRIDETSLGRGISLPVQVDVKSGNPIEDDAQEEAIIDDEPIGVIASDLSGELPDHNLSDFFRYLQTDVSEGNSPNERTHSIREYLFSTLPRDKAEELIDLYDKFTTFERDVVSKAENEWRMPESAGETLELIEAMQQYQQDYFGEQAADLLFGAEMKVMEYKARRAIILNDPYITGPEKEQLLDQLGTDMWGESAYQAMNANKHPHEILDEKLMVYRNELAALDQATRAEEIQKLRDMYLPPSS